MYLPVYLPVDGRCYEHLKRHVQFDESDAWVVRHNNVRLSGCDGDLLQKGVQLMRRVDSNTLGGWEVLQGSIDGLQDRIEFVIVPPPEHRGRH